jgi:hypothetical protein
LELPWSSCLFWSDPSCGALLGDARPLNSGSCGGADYLGTYIIDFYIGHMVFTRVCFPYTRFVMVCMCVLLVKLPFQTVMGRVPVLEYMLSGAHGFLRPCLISSGNECFCPPRPRCWPCLFGNGSP